MSDTPTCSHCAVNKAEVRVRTPPHHITGQTLEASICRECLDGEYPHGTRVLEYLGRATEPKELNLANRVHWLEKRMKMLEAEVALLSQKKRRENPVVRWLLKGKKK